MRLLRLSQGPFVKLICRHNAFDPVFNIHINVRNTAGMPVETRRATVVGAAPSHMISCIDYVRTHNLYCISISVNICASFGVLLFAFFFLSSSVWCHLHIVGAWLGLGPGPTMWMGIGNREWGVCCAHFLLACSMRVHGYSYFVCWFLCVIQMSNGNNLFGCVVILVSRTHRNGCRRRE